MKKSHALLMISVLALVGCVSRDEADAKLARACAAGVEAFLPEGHKIGSVRQTTFADSEELGKGYRVAHMQYADNDGFSDTDKDATCTFIEQFGFMNAGYTAQVYSLKMDENVWGKQGAEIMGSYEENLKLHERVDEVLNSRAGAAPPAAPAETPADEPAKTE